MAQNTPDPIFVSVKEAARIVAHSPITVYRLLDSGEIEGKELGRRRLVNYRSLLAYAESLPDTKAEVS